jgi:hypothetical protein
MENIDQKIAERQQEALSKAFYNKAQEIVKRFGNGDQYDDGDIKITRFHYDQQFTGGEDNIEIFSSGKSVYLGNGNAYTGPCAGDIKRYVPGDWEKEFNLIAAKANPQRRDHRQELRNNWGL